VERCPLCRATLAGAPTCRRCRAELQSAQRVERQAQALVDVAVHSLSLDDFDSARRMLQRALALHATKETRVLWQAVGASRQAHSPPGLADMAAEPQDLVAFERHEVEAVAASREDAQLTRPDLAPPMIGSPPSPGGCAAGLPCVSAV
jgi:hypothetical protein